MKQEITSSSLVDHPKLEKLMGPPNIDLQAIVVTVVALGAVAGIVIWNILVWLWPFVKAYLHMITA